MKLFEISWEVCNKVGGINTVLKSKAKYVSEKFGKDYFLIGPFFKDKARGEFLQRSVPRELKGGFERVKNKGIFCRFGEWLIPGKPNVILIELTDNFLKNVNYFKTKYWDVYHIDSLNSNFYDYDLPLIWSTAAGILIEELFNDFVNKNEKFLVHLHEWLSAGAGLYLKLDKTKDVSKIPIVFTTHATVLGRAIAGTGINLYEIIETIDPEKEAYKLFVHTKHQTEKAIALVSDVFTTVSEITAYEAEKFFGRRVDKVLPNGINPLDLTLEELLMKHRELRDKMRYFLTYLFFPYYPVDLEESLTFYLAARYEFKAKGIDLYLDALAKLNKLLIDNNSKKTIFAFVFVPAGGRAIREDIIENREIVNDFSDKLFSERDELFNKLFHDLLAGKNSNIKDLLSPELITELSKLMLYFNKQGNPPVITHYIDFEESDAILNRIKKLNLLNQKENKVKVIFYPIYLTGKDGLLNLEYSEVIIGSHFGIFPSIYEPWGYTPLECAMRAVPSLTTDLSGFGRSLLSNKDLNDGIFVLHVANKSYEEQVNELATIMFEFSKLTRKERINYKVKAYNTALSFSWSNLILNYFDIYNQLIK